MRILHYVSLGTVGGVEHQFAQFIHYTRRHYGVEHAVIACSKQVHPHLRHEIGEDARSVAFEKRAGRLKIPSWLPGARAAHQKRIARSAAPDVALLWNRMGENWRAVRAVGAQRCIYWDRGSSWLPGDEPEKRRLLAAVGCALSNSHASRRMLQLRWDFQGDIALCLNALRPNMVPSESRARSFPATERTRIGVAARLESIKGVVLAIHTMAALKSRGFDAELHIAGTGNDEATIERLIGQLGLQHDVVLHGLVRDMSAFYTSMHCLLHLALREPFGAVNVEAMVHGCPVVTSNVDGLPEVVTHGQSGIVVQPRLDLATYRELGGKTGNLPAYVYDPASDMIGTPRIVDPEEAATQITRLFDDREGYERMSANAIEEARTRFAYDRHAREVMAAVTRFRYDGRVSAD